eukprot:GHVH01002172.1.p1 GENE.GHVH01002172.1~~GHVH01002172.1.p1  ORF type:complete len:355 (+),score=42.13 GHVH01002172.1:51-1067(+)
MEGPVCQFVSDDAYSTWSDTRSKTTNRIVLIGAGMVGQAFLYSAMNQGIAEEYGLIDVFPAAAKGNEMDLTDAIPTLPTSCRVKSGGYELVSGADLLVVCAGRPQKEGETRIEMVADNARIMTDVANQVKQHGFTGITLIAANPVDVMTQVYMTITGFEPKTVISSGCVLDTSRLQVAIADVVGCQPSNLNLFVLGEHGDSSVSTFTNASICGCPIKDVLVNKCCPGVPVEKAMQEVHDSVFKKAYEIISRKRFTNYGIGACLARISRAVLRNECAVLSVGTMLNGEYGQKGVVVSVPCLIGSEGVRKTFEFPLSDDEKAKFVKSCDMLRSTFNSITL